MLTISRAGIAALAIVVREDAKRLRERLRLSNAEYARLALAAGLVEELHGRDGRFSPHELNTMLFLHGRAGAADALALLHAESDAPPDDAGWRQAATFIAEAEPPTFPLKGADLVARGVAPGRALGLSSLTASKALGSSSASVSTNLRSKRRVWAAAPKSCRGPSAVMNSAALIAAPRTSASASAQPAACMK